MSEKEYEMDDDYKQALAFLLERIAERDEIAEQMKLLPPAARPEGLRLLAELDKGIERSEQALADEYDAGQKVRRSEEERDQAFDELTEGLAGAYVHAKYRNPDMLPNLDAVIEGMDDEHGTQFRQAIARHESGDLISIIARQGETREQTEEFLENYRAAEKAAPSNWIKKH